MSFVTRFGIDFAERGWLPDGLLQWGIRQLIAKRQQTLLSNDCEQVRQLEQTFIAGMDNSVIAALPSKANEQHYELPVEFFDHILGRHRKYSCCWWPDHVQSLDAAEQAALEITCSRAGIREGARVLELGCGWGSLTLWMAQHYPTASITAVSNSHSQRQFILSEVARLDLSNVQIVTADMNHFKTSQRFDHVVSVEMFEHMRNYRRLFSRIYDWLLPGGQFFLHIFCHRTQPYVFTDETTDDWMGRHFFSGGIMPSDTLPIYFQDHLKLKEHWRWSGRHYQRTAAAWVHNMDRHRDFILPILAKNYGSGEALGWLMRWRMFFLTCAQLFGWDNGQEWWVSHYLFERPRHVA